MPFYYPREKYVISPSPYVVHPVFSQRNGRCRKAGIRERILSELLEFERDDEQKRNGVSRRRSGRRFFERSIRSSYSRCESAESWE